MTGTCLENKSNSVSFLDSQVIPPKTILFQVLSYFQVLNVYDIYIYIYYLSTLYVYSTINYSHIFSSTLSIAQMSKLCSTAMFLSPPEFIILKKHMSTGWLTEFPTHWHNPPNICLYIYIYIYSYTSIIIYIYIYIYLFICVLIYLLLLVYLLIY